MNGHEDVNALAREWRRAVEAQISLDEMDCRFYSMHMLARWYWCYAGLLDCIATGDNT